MSYVNDGVASPGTVAPGPLMLKSVAGALDNRSVTQLLPQPIDSRTPNLAPPNHGPVPCKDFNAFYQARLQPRWGTASDHRSTS